ncbi:hypothetical protein JKF63_03585 [Porcisia hertigi]|uniref:TRUD domain-containing protein n=1 Tax=Porcisia hertigi TaxID=2761500 RepID=A0A836HWU3_9TRYP|nr:hypothetical protein JKF63_03585 [Porcisia hertigi]
MRCLRTRQPHNCTSLFPLATNRHVHSDDAALSASALPGQFANASRDVLVGNASLTNSSTPAAAPGVEWWREWPSRERLERVDTLTYLLGRYPRTSAGVAPSASVNGASATTTVPTSSSRPASQAPAVLASSSSAKQRPTKQQKLSALSAHAVPARAQLIRATSSLLQKEQGVGLARANHQDKSAASVPEPVSASAPTRKLLATSSADATVTGATPFTQLSVVERRARRWLRRDCLAQRRLEQLQTTADEAWQSLLEHPPALYADEKAVASRFGMGGYVTPHTRGFSGLFRQQWQDFHVTEMVVVDVDPSLSTRGEAAPAVEGSEGVRRVEQRFGSCGARPLSRDFSFSIPPLPSSVMEKGGVESLAGERETRVAEDCRHDGVPKSAPQSAQIDSAEPSFFQVDVGKRIRQLQEEAVVAKDRQAVVEALLREERRHSPRMRSASAPGSSPHEGNVGTMPGDGELQGSSSRGRAAGTFFGVDSSTGAAPPDSEAALRQCASSRCAQGGDNGVLDCSDDGERCRYLQCTLHKQHMAHGNALAHIAQTLRIHPRSISVAGIKDYIGDTVQRVRLENVSPAAALEANRRFRQKGLPMTLSDFSYESRPLMPGDLFGNHFRVVLRDVSVPRSELADAIAALGENGFPNYYGCQRFSWFGGRQDAAFALLRHNWLAFAFLFLNYTGKDRSLRELLQRPKKYPHPSQDEYRRRVVRRLRQIAVEPTDLDVAPFLSCPPLSAVLSHADGQPFNKTEELICTQLREAYFDLHVQSRRLTAQRLSSFLWNQALTLRLHHLGAAQVLDGDMVAPAALRQLSTSVEDRRDWFQAFGDRITSENRDRYTIEDVVHPGFSFDGIALPQNIVGAYYRQICDKYSLDWMAQHSRSGLKDFREPPRPIIRKPLNLSYEYNEVACVLTLQFALERGCYANVALSELLKPLRCLGSEAVTVLPLPETLWGELGEEDPGYVMTLQDIYQGYEDGVGFMNDEAPVEVARGSESKVWDHVGPLFIPEAQDPFRRAHRWGSQHLLRNSERREREAEDMKRFLFDRPLAKQLKEGEVETYAGHTVPLPPNASAKQVYAKVMRRKRRYAGSPRMVPRIPRSTSSTSHRTRSRGSTKSLPPFQSLNKNAWNFTW